MKCLSITVVGLIFILVIHTFFLVMSCSPLPSYPWSRAKIRECSCSLQLSWSYSWSCRACLLLPFSSSHVSRVNIRPRNDPDGAFGLLFGWDLNAEQLLYGGGGAMHRIINLMLHLRLFRFIAVSAKTPMLQCARLASLPLLNS
jgi:hypothetical protein